MVWVWRGGCVQGQKTHSLPHVIDKEHAQTCISAAVEIPTHMSNEYVQLCKGPSDSRQLTAISCAGLFLPDYKTINAVNLETSVSQRWKRPDDCAARQRMMTDSFLTRRVSQVTRINNAYAVIFVILTSNGNIVVYKWYDSDHHLICFNIKAEHEVFPWHHTKRKLDSIFRPSNSHSDWKYAKRLKGLKDKLTTNDNNSHWRCDSKYLS